MKIGLNGGDLTLVALVILTICSANPLCSSMECVMVMHNNFEQSAAYRLPVRQILFWSRSCTGTNKKYRNLSTAAILLKSFICKAL